MPEGSLGNCSPVSICHSLAWCCLWAGQSQCPWGPSFTGAHLTCSLPVLCAVLGSRTFVQHLHAGRPHVLVWEDMLLSPARGLFLNRGRWQNPAQCPGRTGGSVDRHPSRGTLPQGPPQLLRLGQSWKGVQSRCWGFWLSYSEEGSPSSRSPRPQAPHFRKSPSTVSSHLPRCGLCSAPKSCTPPTSTLDPGLDKPAAGCSTQGHCRGRLRSLQAPPTP